MSYTNTQYLVAQHQATLQAEASDSHRARRIHEGPSLLDRIAGRFRGNRRNPAPTRPVAAGC